MIQDTNINALIDRSGEHWAWKGYKDSFGKPKFIVNGRYVPAHRAVFEHFYGVNSPYRVGFPRKECRKVNCINPAHMAEWLVKDMGGGVREWVQMPGRTPLILPPPPAAPKTREYKVSIVLKALRMLGNGASEHYVLKDTGITKEDLDKLREFLEETSGQ
jgi:hypothetical protein